MAAKIIKFGPDARSALKRGVDTLADAGESYSRTSRT